MQLTEGFSALVTKINTINSPCCILSAQTFSLLSRILEASMKHFVKATILASALTLSSLTFAADVQNCSAIKSDPDRLACWDKNAEKTKGDAQKGTKKRNDDAAKAAQGRPAPADTPAALPERLQTTTQPAPAN